MKKEFSQKLGFFGLFLCMAATLLALGSIIYFISVRGFRVLNWDFLTQAPYSAMTKGGIAPVIVGTFYITLGAIIFALPLGLACAVYLCEYSPKSIVVNIIRISINNLMMQRFLALASEIQKENCWYLTSIIVQASLVSTERKAG
jgi:phosphate transport system permease protein